MKQTGVYDKKFLDNYMDMAIRSAKEFIDNPNNRQALKKNVFNLGRVFIIKSNIKSKDVFNYMELFLMGVGDLTYREFMNIYPPTKEYDGDKWDCKDYYFTMEHMKDKDLDSTIGKDRAKELILCEYYSKEIMYIGCGIMSTVCRLTEEQTGINPTLAFFTPEIYPKDSKGNLIGVTPNGKVHKMENPRGEVSKPKLRVIK